MIRVANAILLIIALATTGLAGSGCTATRDSWNQALDRPSEAEAPLLVDDEPLVFFLTRRLWTDRYYHPFSRPDVQVAFQSSEPAAILVSYREQFENTRRVRLRTFWLDLESEYDPHSKPAFVDAADYAGFVPVPMLGPAFGSDQVPVTGYAGMELLEPPAFELWRDSTSLGRFELPAYEGDAPVTMVTIAKTPFTLLGGCLVFAGLALAALGQ